MNTNYCPNCRAQFSFSDQKTPSFCPHCGAALSTGSQAPAEADQDKNIPALNAFSFFFPVIGLVLWAIFHDEKPKRAKGVMRWTAASLITAAVVFILVLVLGMLIVFGFLISLRQSTLF